MLKLETSSPEAWVWKMELDLLSLRWLELINEVTPPGFSFNFNADTAKTDLVILFIGYGPSTKPVLLTLFIRFFGLLKCSE